MWAAAAVSAYLLAYSLAQTNAGTDFGDWPKNWELPIQDPIDSVFDWIGDTFSWFFNPISDVIDAVLSWIDFFLLCCLGPWLSPLPLSVAYRLGGKWLGLFCGAAILYIGLNGYWDSAMLTLSVLAVSVLIAVAFGVVVGILAASSTASSQSFAPSSTPCRFCPPSSISSRP